jgi:hypothetical protein
MKSTSSQLVEVASWRVAAEVMRRYPGLLLLIGTHPGGGRLLSLYERPIPATACTSTGTGAAAYACTVARWSDGRRSTSKGFNLASKEADMNLNGAHGSPAESGGCGRRSGTAADANPELARRGDTPVLDGTGPARAVGPLGH